MFLVDMQLQVRSGNMFHNVGPAMQKHQEPKSSLCGGACNRLEWIRRKRQAAVHEINRVDRYDGAAE